MRRGLCLVTAIVALGVVLGAAHPHYKKGGTPVCTVTDLTADCSGGLVAGLGNEDVRVTVALSVSAPTFCHNPGNSNIVPGQNPAIATGSTSIDLSADLIKNGTLALPPISTTVTLVTPTPDAAGCPNDNWTVTVGDATVGPGAYTFEQPPGTPIEDLSFTF